MASSKAHEQRPNEGTYQRAEPQPLEQSSYSEELSFEQWKPTMPLCVPSTEPSRKLKRHIESRVERRLSLELFKSSTSDTTWSDDDLRLGCAWAEYLVKQKIKKIRVKVERAIWPCRPSSMEGDITREEDACKNIAISDTLLPVKLDSDALREAFENGLHAARLVSNIVESWVIPVNNTKWERNTECEAEGRLSYTTAMNDAHEVTPSGSLVSKRFELVAGNPRKIRESASQPIKLQTVHLGRYNFIILIFVVQCIALKEIGHIWPLHAWLM